MIEGMQKLIFKFIKHLNMHLDVPGRYRGIQLERNSHHHVKNWMAVEKHVGPQLQVV
jgi:hypothetical protein